jgi:carboxyl-terminal processing protease
MNAQRTGKDMGRMAGRLGVVATLVALSACGGGSSSGSLGGGGGGGGGGGLGGGWVEGVYQPSSNFAARCAAPRSGTNDRSGSANDEKNFLRSWTNETYLWYNEVTDRNPASTPDVLDYFDLLKTTAKTPSNNDKDRFHFTYSTAEWQQLTQGIEVSYGVQFALLATTPPRRAVIAYVEPAAPGPTAAANLSRGVEIITVDGVDLANTSTQQGVDTLNNGLFPDTAGEQHTFTVRELNGTTRTVTLTAATVNNNPVPTATTIPTASGPVGYLLFNDHNEPSEAALVSAINNLRTQGVVDLVLDLRYNGGGLLDIASELAYMIAGPTNTAGKTFERLQFNDKNPTTNPVTGGALTPTPFHTRGQGFSVSTSTNLPTLNLSRVFVLTGAGTCSASESIINGLKGAGVPVIQIGNTTCGKPYGFYPTDNCGTTYFSIQFRGVNNANFGDYADGFAPSASPANQAQLQGCSVNDDFTQALGNVNENRLEAALAYRANGGQCVALAVDSELAAARPIVPKSEYRMNRILRDQRP